jgi:uncharacterized protein YuzE
MTLQIGHLRFDHVVYDDVADVLYLSVGEPRTAARSVATEEGHAVRYDDEGHVIGVTLVNAKWLSERDGHVGIRVELAADDLASALTPA